MATQIKVNKKHDRDKKIIYLSRQEAVGLIQNLIVLLTDPIGGGITSLMVHCEDRRRNAYRLFLVPRKPENPPYKVDVDGIMVEADSLTDAVKLVDVVKGKKKLKGKKNDIRKYRRRVSKA
jgi:hypothetical protein